ncbi:hypothetical protein CC86DRAFT_454957 [Ophiobolus disseminans]|uniref:Heterokaryon incompatibility domain-containing protein n=1 Tax=Ophiobolus disseminans TaxID=1469910 RepID=A0A6A7A3C0_9PLEO|nr:hypothetical protein CC86DRAFT_454957 [Ophiobolus disseminans]
MARTEGRLSGLPSFKLIDCERKVVVPAPAYCDYAALSYVWGPETLPPSPDQPSGHIQQPPNSTNSSVATPIHSLPKTVSDAMEVVLRLGMRYLWVDKICINQSDPREMHAQLSAMDSIYEPAHITIIAAPGSSVLFFLV